MESGVDFVQWLGDDMSIEVFLHLEDPSDIARVCAVSRSWRQFVIANGLSKQLCLKLLPEMSSVACVVEVNNMIEPARTERSDCLEWDCLERNHRVFAQLARGLTPTLREDCITEPISASSTDNYPEENIWNTLESNDRVEQGASYWSSKGQSDTAVPEILLYKLIANLCLVTEIRIQPFQAYFQYGFPIYSSKAVRFRLGYPKLPMQLESVATVNSIASQSPMDGKFIWTYTSPEFPMSQENCLQKFKLPDPVLCIGGILQVELLGRAQRQEMDGLYYICISHVQAVGRPLSRPFDVEIIDPKGKCTLKYHSQKEYSMLSSSSPKGETGGMSRLQTFTVRWMERGIRGWENMILKTLLGIRPSEEDQSDDEYLEDSSDEEFFA